MSDITVTSEGILHFDSLAEWSDFTQIVLTYEPEMVRNGVLVLAAHRRLDMSLYNGEYFDFISTSEEFAALVEGLPRYLDLRVPDLRAAIETELYDLLLWKAPEAPQ